MTAEILGVAAVIGGLVGVPGIVLWLLGRKDANKKLDIEGDALSLAKFNALLAAYESRDRVREQDIEDLKNIVQKQNEAIADLQQKDREKSQELDDTNEKLNTLRQLFKDFLQRTGTSLTTEELEIFDATVPRARSRLRGSTYNAGYVSRSFAPSTKEEGAP